MSLVRSDPTDGFKAGTWVKSMAAWCAVWAVAILVAVPYNSPLWQHVVGFAIFYAAGWISPPVWLVAYITERVVAGRARKRRGA